MPKFVIERNIPGAGKLDPDALQRVSQKSCSVLQEMGPQIQWVHSYVTDDKLYCIYLAPSAISSASMPSRAVFPRIRSARSAL